MIEGKYAVVAPDRGLMENRISADRSDDRIAFRLQFLHRRCDLIDFLPAEQTVLSAVRIEARNRHLTLGDSKSLQGCKALFHASLNVIFRNVIQHIAQ